MKKRKSILTSIANRASTTLFCGLDYPCPHMPGLEEQVAMAHKLRKEIEKNG